MFFFKVSLLLYRFTSYISFYVFFKIILEFCTLEVDEIETGHTYIKILRYMNQQRINIFLEFIKYFIHFYFVYPVC